MTKLPVEWDSHKRPGFRASTLFDVGVDVSDENEVIQFPVVGVKVSQVLNLWSFHEIGEGLVEGILKDTNKAFCVMCRTSEYICRKFQYYNVEVAKRAFVSQKNRRN